MQGKSVIFAGETLFVREKTASLKNHLRMMSISSFV